MNKNTMILEMVVSGQQLPLGCKIEQTLIYPIFSQPKVSGATPELKSVVAFCLVRFTPQQFAAYQEMNKPQNGHNGGNDEH